MKEPGIRERHLAAEDVVARVFPTGEENAPVPLHLAVCAACQQKVARLREAWLLDRGAVDGVVDAHAEVFWNDQAAAVMRAVRTEPVPASSNLRTFPFGFEPAILRRPALAFSSLAAALLLVASVTVYRATSRPSASTASVVPPAVTPVAAEPSDDDLLRSIDALVVPDSPFAALDQES